MTPEAMHVAREHLAVAAERVDALLDAGAAGIEQADDRRAVLQRHVLDLGHLAGVAARQRAAHDREVLGEDVDDAAVDGAPAGDDAVARGLLLLHAEIGAGMLDEGVELLEGVLVHQELDALAGGQLAALVLRVDARLPAAEAGFGPALLQLFDDVLHDLPSRTRLAGAKPSRGLIACGLARENAGQARGYAAFGAAGVPELGWRSGGSAGTAAGRGWRARLWPPR